MRANPSVRPKLDLKNYFNYQTFVLDQSKDGFSGRLVLAVHKDFKKLKADEHALADDQKPAVLELLDVNGKVLEKCVLETGFPSVQEKQLYGNNQSVYFVLQVESQDHGGESGDHLSWLRVMDKGSKVESWNFKNGKNLINWKMDPEAVRPLPVLLRNYGGSTDWGHWKLVPSKFGKGEDILAWETRCIKGDCQAADQEESDYETTFKRYFFNGKNWVLLQRIVKGYADHGTHKVGEDWYPAESQFPDIPK